MAKRIQLFEQFNNVVNFNMLLESVTGDISTIKDEVKTEMAELEKDGATDDETKAALLMQAIDLDGDLEEIDIDKLKKDVKEGMLIRGEGLNESAEGVIHIIEVIGNIAGNSALIEYLCEKAEKVTGKKMDAGKVKTTILGIVGALKKVTGLPAKAIEKFFEFIGHKTGMNAAGTKGLELVGMVAVIVFFFAMGVMHFPVLGSGILWWLLSLTGLVGKSIELIRIGKEIAHLIGGGDKKKIQDEISGVEPDELAKMAGA
jgi:hypothetical protein